MMRNALAVIVGLAVGMAVNMALIELNQRVLFPLPEGLDTQDTEQLQAYLDTLPTAGFLVPLFAHLGQAFVGGWVAARLGSSRPMLLAMIVGLVSLAGGIMMLTMVEGPAWMFIELPLYLLVAWRAGGIEVKRRSAA